MALKVQNCPKLTSPFKSELKEHRYAESTAPEQFWFSSENKYYKNLPNIDIFIFLPVLLPVSVSPGGDSYMEKNKLHERCRVKLLKKKIRQICKVFRQI